MEHQNQFKKTLTEQEYYKPFYGAAEAVPGSKHHAALERAWKNRDFEIDKYWSRATYFWAFIAVSLVAYTSALNSKDIQAAFPQLSFLIACLGFIFSLSWLLVNIGSKKWQENWEKHIDMLEDAVTGPLYKTVLVRKSYSVSRINIHTSRFMMFMWVAIIFRTLICSVIDYHKHNSPDWWLIGASSATAFYGFLLLGITTKRGEDKDKTFHFSRRIRKYETL